MKKDRPPSLPINEIFFSLQGEGNHQGLPCLFVRTGGCALRCTYCDTKYAYHQYESKSVPEILTELSRWNCKLVQVTGGEPLEAPGIDSLLRALIENEYEVLLETGGHISLEIIPESIRSKVITLLDLKTPDSGEVEKNLWENLDFLRQKDSVKFVICSERDYVWSREVVQRSLKGFPGTILFSPANPDTMEPKIRKSMVGMIDEKGLAEKILHDTLPVKFQVQLHKILWGNARGK